MHSVFGIMIVLSFCDFKFMKDNFFFLKSTLGRGWFDIFCSFMFLVTVGDGNGSFTGYIMLAVLLACGGFFVFLGYCSETDPGEGADYDSAALSKQAGTTALLASQGN